jgi:hypothetical protein
MKSFPLTIVAISISIILVLGVGVVSALNPDDASVTVSWGSLKYYQGDTASVSITFQSNIADELEINRISIQFDWMPEDAFYTHDLSASPVHIPSLGSSTFDLTNIPLIAGASAGSHSFYVSIDYQQNNLDAIWNSPLLTMQIYSGNEKTYKTLQPQVATKIDEANNVTYESTEAQSLLQQAKTEYNNAVESAANGEWQEAVTSLQNASDYLDQAEAAEQSGGQNAGQSLLLYIAVAVIAVVIALSVIGVLVRRRSKKTELVEPAEPVEPVE